MSYKRSKVKGVVIMKLLPSDSVVKLISGTCARHYSKNTLQLHKVKRVGRLYNVFVYIPCVFIQSHELS